MYLSSPRTRTLARTVTRYLTHYAGNDTRRSPNGGVFIPLERIAWSDNKASVPTAPPNTPLLGLHRKGNRGNNNTTTPTLMSLHSHQTDNPSVGEVDHQREPSSLVSLKGNTHNMMPDNAPQRRWVLNTPLQVHQMKPPPEQRSTADASTRKPQSHVLNQANTAIESESESDFYDQTIYEMRERVVHKTRNETKLGNTEKIYVLPRVNLSSGAEKNNSTDHKQLQTKSDVSGSAKRPHANAKVLLRSRSLPSENENDKSPNTSIRFTGRTSPVLGRQSSPGPLITRRNSLGNPSTHDTEPLTLGNISHPRHRAAKLLADTASNGHGWVQNYLKAYWVLSSVDSRTLASVSVSADILGSTSADESIGKAGSLRLLHTQ